MIREVERWNHRVFKQIPLANGDIIYEADEDHWIVAHEVSDVLWLVKTNAKAPDGLEWADFWTSDDPVPYFQTIKDAEEYLDEVKK